MRCTFGILAAGRLPASQHLAFILRRSARCSFLRNIRSNNPGADAADGKDCFVEESRRPLARERVIADAAEVVRRAPDIIVGSLCGKKFRPEQVRARAGWEAVPAVRGDQLYEIKSADILSPGPGAITEGLAQLGRIVAQWAHGAASRT